MRRPIETRVVILISRSLRVQVDRFELRICGASGARPGAHQPLAPPESLQGPRGRERQRRTTVGFSEIDHHRDAAVLPSSLARTLRIRNDLPFRCLSVAHRPHPIGGHTLAFKVLRNCFGALLTKPEVVRLAARGIGETLDGDDRLLVVPADHLSKAIQNGFILRSDGSVVEGEVDGGAKANRGLEALDSDFEVAAKLAEVRLQGCKSAVHLIVHFVHSVAQTVLDSHVLSLHLSLHLLPELIQLRSELLLIHMGASDSNKKKARDDRSANTSASRSFDSRCPHSVSPHRSELGRVCPLPERQMGCHSRVEPR